MKSSEIILMHTTFFVVLLKLYTAAPVCSNDQYWFPTTGTCEPCSSICDPPRVHVRDCPKWCPNYTPLTTPTTTTTDQFSTPAVPGNQQQSTESLPTYAIILICTAGVLFGNIALGCFCYKKRDSLKTRFPLRQILRKVRYRITVIAEQPVEDDETQRPDEANGSLVQMSNGDGDDS